MIIKRNNDNKTLKLFDFYDTHIVRHDYDEALFM